ncbi:MAG: hypothetical protein LBG59_05075 [Candidatus Peribacteria bacterium]|jgi:hypothetical protein|nr:hypothetical protein [Candidatus Peribacteria bacterium]
MLNKPNPKLDSILSDINAKTGLRNSSNVVAEKKQEIFNLLKTEIAEGIDDEQKLEQLKMKLEEKKALFEKNLGL